MVSSIRRSSAVRALLLSLVAGGLCSVAAGQQAQIVANINTSLNPIGVISNPKNFTVLGSTCVFVAADPAHGAELWRTDGTAAGTVLLRDINPGPIGSNASEFCVIGSKAYFVADNGAGQDLWVTDGTRDGTKRLRTVTAVSGAAPAEKWWLTNVNGTLFFVGNTNDEGAELWKSDGTAAGTVLVKDILPGPVSSNIRNLYAIGSTLYFGATDTGLGNELWKSDGTPNGTVQVAQINPNEEGSDPQRMIAFNNTLYFMADDGEHGRELWKSDGTPGGTMLVRDIVAGNGHANPNWMCVFNNALYVVMDSPAANAQSIYRTTGGTHLKPVAGYDAGQQITKFAELVTTPTRLYFRAYTVADGEEVFRLKASGSGAEITENIVVGLAGSLPRGLVTVGEDLYLQANSLADGIELWKWNGTSAAMVRNINAVGGASSYPTGITKFGSKIIFGAQDGVHGIEAWISDGTTAGTALLKDIAQGDGDSYPATGVAFGGKLLFSADDGLGQFLHGREPWISNGTAGGTFMLKDINLNEVSSVSINDFFTVGTSRAYFSANNTTNGRELWTTDGTSGGTVIVRDINPGAVSGATAAPAHAIIGDTLYFPALDNVSGVELWKSDGTSAGTSRVRDLNIGTASGMGVQGDWALAADGATIWFAGNTAANGVELYRSDGTSAGTVRMTDIVSGAGSSVPNNFVFFNGTIYFTAGTPALGNEWYRLAPVTNAVQMLKDINPGIGSGSALNAEKPLVIGSRMFFVADDGVSGSELWVTSGDPANPSATRMILDINPSGPSNPSNLTALPDGRVLFAADNGVHGRELWTTDGTSEGTSMLIDLKPGLESGIVAGKFVSAFGRVYFAGDNGSHGIELWSTDGVQSHTYMHTDLNPGLLSSNVRDLRIVGSDLYFSATDGFRGQELWKIRIKCNPADIADSAATPGSDGMVNEGDYNSFFMGYFSAVPNCDIADDAGIAPPAGTNSGVNEGDFNAFFQNFFLGC